MRLPPGVAHALLRGETAYVCASASALPKADGGRADFVVLPLELVCLYPDSLVVVEALEFAGKGLIVHGTLVGSALLRRLLALFEVLQLTAQWLNEEGQRTEPPTGPDASAKGRWIVRVVRREWRE